MRVGGASYPDSAIETYQPESQRASGVPRRASAVAEAAGPVNHGVERAATRATTQTKTSQTAPRRRTRRGVAGAGMRVYR